MNDTKVTKADILRFKELDARYHGKRIEGKPMGLTADEPTEYRRLSSKLANQYVADHRPATEAPPCRGTVPAKKSPMCSGTSDCQCCNGAPNEECELCSGTGKSASGASVKVGFDIGGVLSKYPDLLRPVVNALLASPDIEVHVLSDMHPRKKCVAAVTSNGFNVPTCNIHSCDYSTHGEECKAVKAREIGLHVLVDDFPGYVATLGAPTLRLLAMPDPTLDYYHESWCTDGTEGNFGRRRKQL